MKTNVTMIRKMGNFNVEQRTKDGMFNATTLLKQWNKFSGMSKELASFFKSKSTKEFIEAIEQDLNRENSPYLKTRGKYGGTWMHPYLFIDFAMWLNPTFKLQVIKFVYDELIKYRHFAGDNYVSLSASGSALPGYNYSRVAKALNWIVFGGHKKGGFRQEASENQLRELNELQTKLAFAIDMGYIKTYDGLISELKKLWRENKGENTFLIS